MKHIKDLNRKQLLELAADMKLTTKDISKVLNLQMDDMSELNTPNLRSLISDKMVERQIKEFLKNRKKK